MYSRRFSFLFVSCVALLCTVSVLYILLILFFGYLFFEFSDAPGSYREDKRNIRKCLDHGPCGMESTTASEILSYPVPTLHSCRHCSPPILIGYPLGLKLLLFIGVRYSSLEQPSTADCVKFSTSTSCSVLLPKLLNEHLKIGIRSVTELARMISFELNYFFGLQKKMPI